MVRFWSFFLLFFAAISADDCSSVKTTSGTLTGKRMKNLKLFLGVPYAVPPVGDLRFRPPVPLQSEDTHRSTQLFAPICFQPPHVKSALNPLLILNPVNMSEDCLYINIYVPEIESEEQIPVMVWLPGEGFNFADPTQFDGSLLAINSKVIVVTVSYRVSVFGFFNALSQDAPGNMGLLDQRLALKWVKKNIRAFGGDPDKVTLFGRFTGAMSVAIHAFSSLSKSESLFQRIILHSGVPDGAWIFNSNPLNAATNLSEASSCVFDHLNDTIQCLKDLPAAVLLNNSLRMPNAWRPSLDFALINQPTLSEAAKGDFAPVDILIGTNSDEGSLCLTILKVLRSRHYEALLNNTLTKTEFNALLKSFILDVYKDPSELVNNLTFFMYAVKSSSSLRHNFIKFCGDLYIQAHSGELANIISSQNVFVYEFSHRPSFSNQPDFISAGHGDDVIYSFGLPLKIQNLAEEEKELTHRMLTTMKNFAYYGNPNAMNETYWPPYSNDSHLVMRFDTDPDTEDVVKSRHQDAVHFWHGLVPNILNYSCPTEKNSPGDSFGTWNAAYMLLVASGILLIFLVLALIGIRRHASSVSFHRLK